MLVEEDFSLPNLIQSRNLLECKHGCEMSPQECAKLSRQLD